MGNFLPSLSLLFLFGLVAFGAQAGSWTRAPGDGFTATTFRYFATDASGRNPAFRQAGLTVYSEYGLTDAVTIGTEIDQTQRTDPTGSGIQGGRSGAFLRARLWSGVAGDVVSAQIGASIPVSSTSIAAAPGGDDSREFKGLLQYGRSLSTPLGDGWGEAALGLAHFTSSRGDEVKLDLTAGIRPDEDWIALAQVFGTFGLRNAAFGGTDFDTVKLKLSVGRQVFGDRTLLIGISRDVLTRRADPGFEVSVSIWSTFSFDGLFGSDDDQASGSNAPANVRSIRSAVSGTP